MTSRFIILVSATALACAQPQVSDGGIRNAASSAPPAFPSGSIAQGSIFSIYGSNLGPASSPAQSYPLQPTLGGVAVQVTSESVTLNAIPIFVSPNLINAILPDNTPVGPATLAVTFGGQASNAALFQVIGSSFEFSPRIRAAGARVSSPVLIISCTASPRRQMPAMSLFCGGQESERRREMMDPPRLRQSIWRASL